MSVTLKTHYGSSVNSCEVNLPDYLDSKIGNSNFNQEVINAISAALPQMIGGSDWRKQGCTVLSYSQAKKL